MNWKEILIFIITFIVSFITAYTISYELEKMWIMRKNGKEAWKRYEEAERIRADKLSILKGEK